MKRSLLILLVLLASTSIFARTQPGKSAVAARITALSMHQDTTGSTYEIGFGRMVTPGAMILFDMGFNYHTHLNKAKSTTATTDGPVYRGYMVSAYPEYRMYLAPRMRVVPYLGIYGLIGYNSGVVESLYPNLLKQQVEADLRLGGGLTLGAEFFLNNFISLAVHARMAEYSFTSHKTTVKHNGHTITNAIKNAHDIGLQFQPALYVRLYF
jgi:hypothetical protein